MNIKEFGGEFKLIDSLTRKKTGPDIVAGVGDDAAVLDYGLKEYILWTTDLLCEGDHFRLGWSSAPQIGRKAMEANVSDIAAMGGVPTHALISVSLKSDTYVEWVKGLYEGIYEVADKYDFEVVGGDTTHSKLKVINVSLLGEVQKDCLCLRSHARAGDLICVTGDLGKSRAGLQLLLNEGEGEGIHHHLEPECRLWESQVIAPHANAMIDVSDGLASEVNHIARESRVGARVYRDKIPVSDSTREAASRLGEDPIEYALNGGEDFELVYTIPRERLGEIELDCPVTVVGEITEREKGVLLETQEGPKPLEGGFNHFA